jgi:hypothetical protein
VTHPPNPRHVIGDQAKQPIRPRPDLTAGPLLPYPTQCQGKIRYPNRARARIGRQRQPWLKLSIYRCGHCGFFHLGTRDAHRDE